MKSLAFTFSVLFAAAVSTFAQTNDLMQREIDGALARGRWRAGQCRLTPVLRVGGGLDSNPLGQPGPDPVEDVTFLVGPGIAGVVPFGNRGLFDFYQEVDFVYYRDLSQLRDIFNVTRAAAAIGGRDFVLHADGEYRTGQTRPTSELDVPLDEDRRRLGAGLDIAIGSAQQLNLRYDKVRLRYQDPEQDVGVSVPNLLDRSEEAFRLELERYVTGTTSAVVRGLFDRIDYVDDTAGRDGQGYGVLGGFVFAPRGDIQGQVLLGYKRLIPDEETQAEFSGFVGSVDVMFPMENIFRLRGLLVRDSRPSVLQNNWFFVENRFGGSLDIYLAERWFIRPGAVVGANTYPTASKRARRSPRW